MKNFLAFLLLVLTPIATGAQNLVQNPDFDTSLDGWSIENDGNTAVWYASDGYPAPGSAHLEANTYVQKMTQCVPLPSSLASSVDFSAAAYMFADTTNLGAGNFALQTSAFADAACADAVWYDGNSIVLPMSAGSWTYLANNFYPLPAGYQSLLVRIEVIGGLDISDFAFDHFVVVQVTDRIFGTGFEVNEGFQN
jgi:hypothetical protein